MARTRTTWSKANPPPKGFRPGVSGNPGGRPRSDVVALARQHAPEAINRLVALMRQGDDLNVALAATAAIIDRGWGKPPQAILAHVDATMTLGGIDKPPILNETDAEWLERRRTELAALEHAKVAVSDSEEPDDITEH